MKTVATQELLDTLDRIAGTPILVVGDLILDRYVWGRVERISPEAPVPVVEVIKTEDRLGGAGNVVRNLCRIGAKASTCGLIGDDDEGQQLLILLDEIGADKDGVIADRSRPTTLKTRIIAQSQQVVRIDREKKIGESRALGEALAAVVDANIDPHRAVIVSDYGKGAVGESLLRRLEEAYGQGRLGLASRPLFVDPHPKNYENYHRLSVAKPNRKEAEIASGRSISSVDDAFAAAKVLAERWNSELIVISLGEDGMVVHRAGEEKGLHLETEAQEVFDVSGAGDTVTALFTAALAVGAPVATAGVLANIAAGIVVSEIGTVAVDIARLRDGVSRWSSR
jgi:D-beta-D-heptose 7-phosphate kinase/D-beta-D-heptose 1-phosphate adenosyltransferase